MDNPTSAPRKNLSDYLAFLWPSFWIMNNPYSANWDRKLRRLLDEHKFASCDHYRAKLGDFYIWIANYPYCCFEPQMPGLPNEVRPSRSTIHYAMRRLWQDLDISADPYPAESESVEVKELRKLYER